MEPLSLQRRRDLYVAKSQFEQLVATGILSPAGSQTPWFEPVITQLLIWLSDLLKAADTLGHRCNFTDDVLCIDDEIANDIKDVHGLILRCRNACCHISSGNMIFETNKFRFCKIVGYGPNAFFINGKILGCEYPDDIALMWGPMRLYIKRNMIRAFEEVAPLFPNPYDHHSPPTNFSNR